MLGVRACHSAMVLTLSMLLAAKSIGYSHGCSGTHAAEGIVRGGHEVVPTWRVLTPDADFLILTKFDLDKPEQRERAFALVPRFMAWKLATGFVLTAETWLGPERTRSGEEAVLTVGVSHHERLAVIRRIIQPG
jgi:hypothetical protein